VKHVYRQLYSESGAKLFVKKVKTLKSMALVDLGGRERGEIRQNADQKGWQRR
jgi:hypothetical protein